MGLAQAPAAPDRGRRDSGPRQHAAAGRPLDASGRISDGADVAPRCRARPDRPGARGAAGARARLGRRHARRHHARDPDADRALHHRHPGPVPEREDLHAQGGLGPLPDDPSPPARLPRRVLARDAVPPRDGLVGSGRAARGRGRAGAGSADLVLRRAPPEHARGRGRHAGRRRRHDRRLLRLRERRGEDWHPLGLNESFAETFETNERIRAEADHIIPLYEPKVFERYPGGVISARANRESRRRR